MNAPGFRNETITVCDACLMACCWQGEFMCERARAAGTVEKTRAELEALALESPHYWGDAGRVPASQEHLTPEDRATLDAYLADHDKRAGLLSSPPLPVERSMPPAAYERLVDDHREYARSYLTAQGFERTQHRLMGRAFLDAWLNERPGGSLAESIGHLRDAEAHPEASEDEADCINDFAAAAYRAALEHGRDGEER